MATVKIYELPANFNIASVDGIFKEECEIRQSGSAFYIQRKDNTTIAVPHNAVAVVKIPEGEWQYYPEGNLATNAIVVDNYEEFASITGMGYFPVCDELGAGYTIAYTGKRLVLIPG